MVSNTICAAQYAPVMGRPIHVSKREWSPFKLSQKLATEEEKEDESGVAEAANGPPTPEWGWPGARWSRE